MTVETEKLTYSNPRKSVVIEDWPSGSYKTKATFVVESAPKGNQERAVRVTVNPKTGRANNPKKLTYATLVRFVDGSDGKLYIIEKSIYSFISVMKGTMDFQHEVIHESQQSERYKEIMKLFEMEAPK